jgi:drug/metabolite transporter (DMT)-like permease
LGAVWGASFLFIKVIVGEASALQLVAGRLSLGAAAVGLAVAYRRKPLGWTPGLVARVSVVAAVNNILPFFLIATGEERIDSGVASVLNSTMPIFTAVLAALFLPGERLTPARLFGLLLGFGGVAALTGKDALHITDADVLSELAVVGAALCYGIGSVYARTLLREQDPLNLSLLQLGLAAAMALPLALAVDGKPATLSLEAVLSLLALGLGGTGIAYVLYLWLIEVAGSVRASLVTYIIPVTGLILGWLVLGEDVGLNTVAGFGLIALGVAAVMRGGTPTPVARRAMK